MYAVLNPGACINEKCTGSKFEHTMVFDISTNTII